MMSFINSIIDSSNAPLLISLLLGILMSISPCPLATNITAIAYISKKIENTRKVLLEGFFYTLGRVISYTALATLIYFGLSGIKIGRFFQTWGDKILGPLLILIALIMLDIVKININTSSNKLEKLKEYFAKKGHLGSILLGVILSLAFCPYSGVLFFAILVPMTLTVSGGPLLASVFGLGSGLPVILFTLIIAFSFQKLNKVFNFVKKTEKVTRYIMSFAFLGVGTYYTYLLVKFLLNQ
jgi:cytochrome c-type biogenesis protein